MVRSPTADPSGTPGAVGRRSGIFLHRIGRPQRTHHPHPKNVVKIRPARDCDHRILRVFSQLPRHFNRALMVLTVVVPFLVVLSDARLSAQTEGELGEFGPPEAYEAGNPHPYFGSENPWNRRMFEQRPADLFYKRRGQRQLLAIMDGRPEEAIAWATARVAEDPGDLESRFMLAIAWARLGQTERAMAAVRLALAAGLPWERFLAGPRDLLEPLSQSAGFKEIRDRLDLQLVHGPMLGDVTSTQARVWVRTAEPSEIVVEATPLAGESKPVVQVRFHTAATRDFTGVGRLEGLEPGTLYRYWLTVQGRSVGRDSNWTFRTYPKEWASGRFTVAFGGCAGYTPKHEKIWDAIQVSRPDAMLFLGDNVYLDVPEVPGAFHRYTYYRRQSRPEFRRLVSSVPVYAIWDDHDAGMDDLCEVAPNRWTGGTEN